MLDHMDNRGSSVRKRLLPDAPSVDFLDQLRLDPDIDFCGFRLMPGVDGALSDTPA
jgi:hypothetical protein